MTNKQDPRDKGRQKFSTTNTTPVAQLVETPRLNVRAVQRPPTSTALASFAGEKTGSTSTSQPQRVEMMSRETEDNFITELWSTLNVDQKQVEWQLIEYDSRTVQFTLSPRFASSGQTIYSSGYGARYVNELLKRCSECRSQLLALRWFSSSGNGDNPDASAMQEFSSMPPSTESNTLTDLLSSLLMDPLRSVMRKFNADVMTEVQESSITIRDLTQFSAFLVNFKQGVEKVFSFFKPLMTPGSSAVSSLPFGSSTGSAFSSTRVQRQQWQEVAIAEQQWHKFLLLLNAHSPRELDDELPVWKRMHKEMLEMLGSYFNLLCRLRLLQVPWPASNAPVQQSQSSQQRQITPRVGNGAAGAQDSALSRSSSRPSMHCPASRLLTPMVPGEVLMSLRADASKSASAVCGGGEDGSQFFRPIWTDRLRADLQGAFHHEERIAAGGVTVPGACTFQEIFQQQTQSNPSSGSIFKDVVQQLESAASAYQAQYEQYIMQGVMEGDRLQTTLAEIKELYSLRVFVHPITCIMRTPNDGWLDTLARAMIEAVGRGSSNQWRLVQRPTPMECIPSEEEMNGSAASSGADRKKQPWWSFELECRLQWPVGCVLGGELFAVLDRCVQRCQQIFNAYNTMVELKIDDDLMRNRKAFRKFLLAQRLQDTIRVIHTVLQSEVESKIEKAAAALLQAKTVEEMECVVRECAIGLDSAIAGNEQLHRESYVLTAADTLCGLIESFQSLQLKCAEDKDGVLAQASAFKVDKVLKKLDRVTQLLTSPLSNYSSLGGGEKRAAVLPDPSSVAYSIAVLLSR